MKRWLEKQGYILCTTLAVWRVCNGWPVAWLENIWTGIWYRYYCPRPVVDDWTARACVCACQCGCSNLDRYAAHSSTDGATR